MEKYITDERTGLKYELIGDYYFIAGEDESEEQPYIGVWGQRHLRYIKEYRKGFFTGLLLEGKLNDYLNDIDHQAQELFSRLIKQMAEKEGITESLKARDQMAWVGAMNNIRSRVSEIVNAEIIYS